jgi:hypothetical protein
MKLSTIINIANKAYPDGLVKQAFEEDTHVGDGLAEFIARELRDTYDETASSLDQLKEATRVMHSAQWELVDVAEAFDLKMSQVLQAKATTPRCRPKSHKRSS